MGQRRQHDAHLKPKVSGFKLSSSTRLTFRSTVVSVLNTTTVGNVTLNIVDAVIDLPGEFVAALAANNLTQFSSALSTAGLLNPVNTQHGITVFAPTDAAFAAAQSNLTAAGSNATLLNIILKNHIINGSTVYTGDLQGHSGSLTSAGGEGISSTFNSSGGFVTSGNSSAAITVPDIILWNGVVHIIDHVLLNQQSDSGAASSAYVILTRFQSIIIISFKIVASRRLLLLPLRPRLLRLVPSDSLQARLRLLQADQDRRHRQSPLRVLLHAFLSPSLDLRPSSQRRVSYSALSLSCRAR